MEDNGELRLKVAIRDFSDLGHLELISYPQRGNVIMKQNGKDVALMKYSSELDFNTYLQIACEPERFKKTTDLFLVERYGNC
ncbi:hypothetical protein BMS3Abin16_00347 [archaeon BMS3Abin16]|nr:hypothetical protein BMS3Abin16_00347 [archaeon BMS3Abin16]HDY73902.1 hypothetical protein [Euryarchaeota archaeon]